MRIILHGYNGRMGRAIAEKSTDIVAGVDVNLDTAAKKNANFPVFENIGDVNIDADVVIDFTNVGAIEGLLHYCVTKKLPLVLCTTGLTPELEAQVKAAQKHIPIFQSYNMSLGINLMARVLKQISPTLHDLGFDIEVVDVHHNKKIDAPSGTAELLAGAITGAIEEKMMLKTNRFDHFAPREKNEIGIHSLRGGTIVGRHQVMFAGENEVIELMHYAESRAIFVKGALTAAQFLMGKAPGHYDMEAVLDALLGK